MIMIFPMNRLTNCQPERGFSRKELDFYSHTSSFCRALVCRLGMEEYGCAGRRGTMRTDTKRFTSCAMLNIIFNGEDLDKVPRSFWVRVHKLWNKSLRSIHNNRRLHTPKSTTYLVIVGLIQQEVGIQTRRELIRHDTIIQPRSFRRPRRGKLEKS